MYTKHIENRDFIIFGIQNWDATIGGNHPRKSLIAEIAKRNRVLFVNTPIDSVSMLKKEKNASEATRIRVLNGLEDNLVQIGENVWNYYPNTVIASINWIRIRFIFNILNWINNWKFAREIKKALQSLNFKNYIIINDNEIFRGFYLKELLKPNCYIYYMRDFLTHQGYWSFHGSSLEPTLIMKADLAVANSHYYTDYLKKFNPNAFFVGQGCDLSRFNGVEASEIPTDLLPISKPIIGYVGNLRSARLDLSLIESIATSVPDWNIVLVGPEDQVFEKSNLHQLPNIYFLKEKSLPDLPAYIQHFDVCINPQQVNPITEGNYPLKIDEYLALGKPVVATYTEAMKLFAGHVYLAKNKEEFIQLIGKAFQENSVDLSNSRKALAASHSWENTVALLYQSILKTTFTKPTAATLPTTY